MAGYQSTYRLQLSAAFPFAAAAAVVPYLADLGVSHLYTSPILRARSGSRHRPELVRPRPGPPPPPPPAAPGAPGRLGPRLRRGRPDPGRPRAGWRGRPARAGRRPAGA